MIIYMFIVFIVRTEKTILLHEAGVLLGSLFYLFFGFEHYNHYKLLSH